jgi:cobalt/nickel transport system permease protein
MNSLFVSPLWAVHIADNVLRPSWIFAGFILAGLLAYLGSWRIRDEEIPRIAVLTAVFFVVSLIHIRVWPTSVHLLLNGLVGIVLRLRAALTIPLGLFLQAILLQHGGFTTLGVNTCDMVLPALLVAAMFAFFQRLPFASRPWFQATLVMVGMATWLFCLIYDSALLLSSSESGVERALSITFHPLVLVAVLGAAGLAAWLERRLQNAWEFALGLLCGMVAVLLTALLTSLVLAWGGIEPQSWRRLAEVLFVAHLPVALVEGIVLGFTVSFLARVKPELLGRLAQERSPWNTHPPP